MVERNPVTFTQHEKYLTQEFCWFWPIIPHDLSHVVGIACFSFSRNLLLSFLLLFLALLVIIKQVHLFFWNLNVKSFTLFIWMEQFSIWSENVQRSPKFTFIDVFTFSFKNPSTTLEPLSRDWHKNWQPACCQLGARLCWKVSITQNSEVSSKFFLLISFEHNASYKQSVNTHYSTAFTVSFYCFLLSRYLGLIAAHHF